MHFYIPKIDGVDDTDVVRHLALDGVIKSGSTYLIRGAQHAELDDESTFIKVTSYDKEWYYKKKDELNNAVDCRLISFEQEVVSTKDDGANEGDDNKVRGAYKFCLTYGIPELGKNAEMIKQNQQGVYITSDGEIVDVNSTTLTKTYV